MLAVANTIQNRMALKNKTAYEIVTEPAQYKGIDSETRILRYSECKEITTKLAKNMGKLQDITDGAFTVQIKNHEFFK